MMFDSAQEAIERLNRGEVVGLPTETVYGLAARMDLPEAVAGVFRIKGRPEGHPLIVHMGSHDDPERYGGFNEQALRLANYFWPGPLTLIVPKNDVVPWGVTGGMHTVGIRIPAHDKAQTVLKGLPAPFVAPSANRFGKVSPTTAQHVVDDLGEGVPVLDGGASVLGLESTILDATTDCIKLVRPGTTPLSHFETCLGKTIPVAEGVKASGTLFSHYAPNAKVWLVSNKHSWAIQPGRVKILELPRSPEERAQRIYGLLREADAQGYDHIVIEIPETHGSDDALMDRLQKASNAKDNDGGGNGHG